MPTLQSVNVHPQLCETLATDATPPITTPLALLSRDAASTAQQLHVPLSVWTEVRLGVANAILRSQNENTAMQSLSKNDDDDDDDDDRLIVGSISALEYWKHSSSPPQFLLESSPISPWLLNAKGICQLTGPPATGKTQLCLDLAVQYSGNVCYLTTTPPVALVRRLRQLVAAKDTNPKKILEKIQVVSLSTPHQLLSILQTFMTTTTNTHESSQLVVVDSISGCLMGGNNTDWNLIQQVGLQLKQLVHLYGVHVICTNGVVSSGEPALGQVWNTQVAEIQITTSTTNAADDGVMTSTMKATLTRHPELQCGGVSSTRNFCITPKGIIQ